MGMTSSRTVSPKRGHGLGGGEAGKGDGQHGRDQDRRAGGGQPVEVVHRAVRRGLRDDGGILMTSLSSMGTGMLDDQVDASGPPAANSALKGLRLHSVTMPVRMMKGDQALRMAPA
jgi:hypothetical protein